MNKIGIHFGYFNTDWDTDFFRQIDQVKRLGFDILEVAPGALMKLAGEQRLAVAEYAGQKGIELTFSVGLGPEYDLASENPNVRRAGIEFTLGTFEIMREMGSTMYSGVNTGAWNQTYAYGVLDKSREWNYSIASVKEIMKSAEEKGIIFAVEVVNRYEASLINTAQEAMEYITRIGSPNCKVLLDTYHMNIEEDSFEGAIRLVGKSLGHFHVGEPNRRPPSPDGRMPWDEIAGALKAIHYEGAIVMEPFIKMGGEVGRDIKVWRDISKNASPEEMERLAAASVQMLREKMQP